MPGGCCLERTESIEILRGLPAKIVEPVDVAFPGHVTLLVDGRDVTRGIFRVTETITGLRPGPMTALYPEWLPGFHAPDAPIELLSGLRIHAGKRRLPWLRDPVVVHAFHLDVPEAADEISLSLNSLADRSKPGPHRRLARFAELKLGHRRALPCRLFRPANSCPA